MTKSHIEEEFALQLRALKLNGWEREYKFHPVRKWRFDFYFPQKKLAVECEGGVWVNGRHNTGVGMVKDMEKYNAAVEMGISILRFAAHMVKSGEAVAQVERMLKQGE